MSAPLQLPRLLVAALVGALLGSALWWLLAADPGYRDHLLGRTPAPLPAEERELTQPPDTTAHAIGDSAPATSPHPSTGRTQPLLDAQVAALLELQSGMRHSAEQALQLPLVPLVPPESPPPPDRSPVAPPVAPPAVGVEPMLQRLQQLRREAQRQATQATPDLPALITLLEELEQESTQLGIPSPIDYAALRELLRAAHQVSESAAQLERELARGEGIDAQRLQAYQQQLEALPPTLSRPVVDAEALERILHGTP